MHAYGVCPLSPAPQPRWAAQSYLRFGDAAVFALRRAFRIREVCVVSLFRCTLWAFETLDDRLSKRLICRFLRLGDYH